MVRQPPQVTELWDQRQLSQKVLFFQSVRRYTTDQNQLNIYQVSPQCLKRPHHCRSVLPLLDGAQHDEAAAERVEYLTFPAEAHRRPSG